MAPKKNPGKATFVPRIPGRKNQKGPHVPQKTPSSRFGKVKYQAMLDGKGKK